MRCPECNTTVWAASPFLSSPSASPPRSPSESDGSGPPNGLNSDPHLTIPAAIHACSGHEQGREKQRYALIILNQPLIGREWFENVWNSCDLRICADGGANRLFDGLGGAEGDADKYIPHHIAGDLDSLRPPVRAFYESRGTHVHAFSDQDSTDLGKCVAVVREVEDGERGLGLPPHTLILLPALSGRFDHVMASIQTVYEIQDGTLHDPYEGRGRTWDRDEREVWLVGEQSVGVVLGKGHHRIICHPAIEGPTCGLIPIGAPARVRTEGLKWNLVPSTPSAFGHLVSTSNAFDPDPARVARYEGWRVVDVETDERVVWTVEVDLKGGGR